MLKLLYSSLRNGLLVFSMTLTASQSFAQIDISKPVGSTSGTVNVSAAGGSTYSVNFDIPPGTNSMIPSIGLSYNSSAGQGIAGMGWNISGISSITRKGKNFLHNGMTTPVNYENNNDAFYLDGMRLFAVTGNNGENNTIYGTEQDDYAKIQSFDYGNYAGPEWFLVTLKDGTRLTYGSSVDSRFFTNGIAVGNKKAAMVWYLKRVIDLKENYYEFHYDNDATSPSSILLTRITYTGSQFAGLLSAYNSINFKYETRPDDVTAYDGGFKSVMRHRLASVEVLTEGTLYKKYTLSYQLKQNQSYLEKITESGATGVALNPTIFDYGNKYQTEDVKVLASYPFLPSQDCITGDFNGDGKVDILAAEFTINNGVKSHKRYNIYDDFGAFGSTGTVSTLYNYTFPILEYELAHYRASGKLFRLQSQDYDNDGKDDVIMVRSVREGSGSSAKRIFAEVSINHTRIYTPSSGWTFFNKTYTQVPTLLGNQCKYIHASGICFLPGDFDGDGSQDYILLLGINSTDGFGAFFSSPAKGIFNSQIASFGVGSSTTFYANTVASADAVLPIDIDGDGKTELMITKGASTYILRVTPLAPSTGYLYGATYTDTDNLIQAGHRVYPGDFNGDGKTDLLWRNTASSSTSDWKVLYSNGRTFTNPTLLPLIHTPILPGDGGYAYAHHLIVADLNGDGKSDVLHALDLSLSQAKYVGYFSDGDGFTVESYQKSGALNGETAVGADINGDGKPDLVSYKAQTGTIAMLKPGREERYLSKITNGIGHITEITYRPLRPDLIAANYIKSSEFEYGNPSETSGGSHLYPYPYNVLSIPMHAVFSIRTPNGIGGQITTDYYYENLQYHSAGRGLLGFKKITANQWSSNRKQIVENEVNNEFLIPFTKKTLSTDGSDLPISETRYEYTFTKVNSIYSDKRFYKKLSKTLEIDKLQDAGVENIYTYDDYGNPTTVVTKSGYYNGTTLTSLETKTFTTTFGQYGTPVPASPLTVSMQSQRTGEPLVTKTTTNTYNTNNTLATQVEFSGQPKAVTTTNTYGSFGNLTQTTTTATGLPVKTSQWTYDPKGRFLIESKKLATGVVQKEVFTYHPVWGKVLTSQSTDGLTTTYEYDAFGRVINEKRPENYTITHTLSWTQIAGVYVITTSQPGGGPDTKKFYDVLGRMIREEASGLNNNWTVSTQLYNSRGQLSEHKDPAYSNEIPRTLSYIYDNFGRRTSITSPEGTTGINYQKLANGQLKITTTSPSGQSTSKTLDAAGKTVSSTDNGGQLNYLYDSWGNQRNVSIGSYNLVQNTYDIYGRSAVSTDINSGATTEEYNAYGELSRSQNPLGNVTTMVYDGLGRLTTKTGAEGTTSYTYFNEAGTGFSNNRPVTITSFNGTNENYTYDNLRRVKTNSQLIDGVNYTYQYEYDAYGNQSKITYPSGVAVEMVYDKNGNVTTVSNSQFATIFTGQSMNSLGKYTGYTLGNGKVVTLIYDVATKLPKRFFIPGVMDMNWVFDVSTGNVSSRKDAILNLTESFTYDNLNRLLTTKVNTVQQLTTTYDNTGGISLGNIKSKTDAGNYVYNNQKIHALAYVTNPAGAQTPPSVIPVAQQDVSYTQFKKTNTVSENNNTLTFTYGADYGRVKSEMKVGGALGERRIYFGMYEKRIDPNGDIEEIHFVPGGNDYCAAIVRKNGTNKIFYLHTDFQGTILAATDNTGLVIAQQNFDSWGRRRNPTNWQYSNVPAVPSWLMRGYTGQEHHNSFGLVNLNGRMYDPILGRMLSPDPFVATAWGTQAYNRYSYSVNNPIIHTDPDGEIVQVVVGAIVGAVIGGGINLGVKLFQGKIKNFGDGLAAFGIGAVAGAIGGATGGAAFIGAGGAAGGAGGFISGAASGAAGAAVSTPIQSIGNTLYFGDPMMTGDQWLLSIGLGALTGGTINGTVASINGRNFWNGSIPIREIQPVPIVTPGPLPTPYAQGQAGLNANNITQNTVRIPSLTQTAQFRVPDEMIISNMKTLVIGEVKNYALGRTVPLTNQIKDFILYAQANSINFHLYVPHGVMLSKPLQTVINQSPFVTVIRF